MTTRTASSATDAAPAAEPTLPLLMRRALLRAWRALMGVSADEHLQYPDQTTGELLHLCFVTPQAVHPGGAGAAVLVHHALARLHAPRAG